MTIQSDEQQSLYQRLGGYDAIAAATDDLIGRAMADPQLRDFWKGVSDDTKRRGRQLTVDFIAQAAGGPAFYTGRDLKTAHAGMHISANDWDILMCHAKATLEHFQVPEREGQEVLAFFASVRGDIVEG